MSSSDDSLPDWVAEHQSPWLPSQAPDSDSTSSDPDKDQLTAEAEQSQHAQRPQGPDLSAVVPSPSIKTSAAAAALVAAPDLPGHVEDGTSTDLAGDAGAVGRFGIIKEDNQQRAQLDLKGEMYGMVTVPCASTLCVMNIRQTEAKVEAIMSEFVQLRQEAGQGGTQDHEDMHLYGDDDENYQENTTAGASAAAADSASGKKTSKAAVKRKSKTKATMSGLRATTKKSSQKKQGHGK